MATVNRYNVRMSLTVSSFPQCCGAKIIHGFNVSGSGTRKLNAEQKHKMYNELFRKVADSTQGMLVAADCVLDFGEWSGLSRSGGGGDTNWIDSHTAGDISLEDFCKYHKFDVTAYAKNSNSGNIVATFSKAVYSVAADEEETVTMYYPNMPDYSDDVQTGGATSTADVSQVLEQLREAVRRAA